VPSSSLLEYRPFAAVDPARALAADSDVQRPGSCELLDRPSSIDRPAAEISLNRKIAGSPAPILAKTKWPLP